MSRLIDADYVIEKFNRINGRDITRPEAIKIVNEATTVEKKYFERIVAQINPVIEARPQGEWIYTQYDGNANIGNWHCSECRHIVYGGYSQKPYYNYCPNCGSDMRKENK